MIRAIIIFLLLFPVNVFADVPEKLEYQEIKVGEVSKIDGYVLSKSGLAFLLRKIDISQEMCEISKNKIIDVCKLELEKQKEKYENLIQSMTLPPQEVYCPKCTKSEVKKNYFWHGVALGTGTTILLFVVGFFAFSSF